MLLSILLALLLLALAFVWPLLFYCHYCQHYFCWLHLGLSLFRIHGIDFGSGLVSWSGGIRAWIFKIYFCGMLRHGNDLHFFWGFPIVQLYLLFKMGHNLFKGSTLQVRLVYGILPARQHIGKYELFYDSLGSNSECVFNQFLEFVHKTNWLLIGWVENYALYFLFRCSRICASSRERFRQFRISVSVVFEKSRVAVAHQLMEGQQNLVCIYRRKVIFIAKLWLTCGACFLLLAWRSRRGAKGDLFLNSCHPFISVTWAGVSRNLTPGDARSRMSITLEVVLILSLVCAKCVQGCLRSGSGVNLS